MMFEKKAKKVLKGRREIPCSCPDCGGVQWYDITPLLDKDIADGVTTNVRKII